MAVVATCMIDALSSWPTRLFFVITNGRNLMGAYGANVTVEDRWAIIAYLRALQLTRLGTVDTCRRN